MTATALVVARPVLVLVVRSWTRWWRSTQRRSTSDGGSREPADQGLETALRPGPDDGVTLARTGWRAPPPGTPLLHDQQRRAVATLLCGRTVPGEIDIEATVARIAARQPLTSVPRRPRWSTSRGLHLHVDFGPALAPFRSDVSHLRRSLVAVASAHTVVELGFNGDPREIVRPRRLAGPTGVARIADHLPSPGTPVLVVTDLGIGVPPAGSPAPAAAFVEHHLLLVRAGCPVRYLVPYPAERWPPAVRQLPILFWSDDLGASDVLLALRRQGRTAWS